MLARLRHGARGRAAGGHGTTTSRTKGRVVSWGVPRCGPSGHACDHGCCKRVHAGTCSTRDHIRHGALVRGSPRGPDATSTQMVPLLCPCPLQHGFTSTRRRDQGMMSYRDRCGGRRRGQRAGRWGLGASGRSGGAAGERRAAQSGAEGVGVGQGQGHWGTAGEADRGERQVQRAWAWGRGGGLAAHSWGDRMGCSGWAADCKGGAGVAGHSWGSWPEHHRGRP